MAINRSLMTAIISSASMLLTLFRANIALAQLSPQEISAIAKPITVRIDGANEGSGVIIGKTDNVYAVVTNWHVVRVLGDYTVQTMDGEIHPVDYGQTQEFPNSTDLAIVKFTSNNDYDVATLGDSETLGEGQTIHLAGYPGTGQIIGESDRFYRFNSLSINAILPDNREGGYSLAYGGENFSGMSGSPILDGNGDVVGINGTAYIDADGKARSNYAIPIDIYKELVNVNATAQPQKNTNEPPNKIAIASNLSAVDAIAEEKLDSVPVFTIADEEGAPLVAIGKDGVKVAGVFISQKDADEFVIQLSVENHELASKVEVVPVSLGEVNYLARQGNINFAYIPEDTEVENAKVILAANGGEYEEDVPLFVPKFRNSQKYLTVNIGGQQVVPFCFELSQLEELVAEYQDESFGMAEVVDIEVRLLSDAIDELENPADDIINSEKIVLVPTAESIQFLQNRK
ncbi:MAG: Tic22 family protein [Cyanobacteria bacterium J06631_2]